MSATLELEITGDMPNGFGHLDLKPLQRVVEAAEGRRDELGLSAGTINLSFVDDAAIQVYNRDYSGNDYPTDVLSFSYIEDGEAIEGVIGEMVISLETAVRQAEAGQLRLEDEVAILGLHGILHVCGYDHQDEEGRARMQLLQEEICATAGVTYRNFEWLD